ncbi:MAG: hypothetical protein ABR574_04375 [Cryomorphaceae bacterium]|nr:hypothetical protein [Flavobacteriales bacterium]
MLSKVLVNIGRFLLLIFLQGVLLNDVNLWDGMAIPYLYILFLLMLPIDIPRWLELLIGLIAGLSLDMFTNTAGIHASACVLLSFLRPIYLRSIAPRDGYEFGVKPTINDMGLAWYIKYAAVLIFIHHAWLFYVEIYSLSGFFNTLLRVFLSSVFTFILVILSQFLISKKKGSNYL